jgi:hypothetical protein
MIEKVLNIFVEKNVLSMFYQKKSWLKKSNDEIQWTKVKEQKSYKSSYVRVYWL